MYRVLITDKLPESAVQILQEKDDFSVDEKLSLSAQELEQTIPDYHGLIVRSATKVTSQIIQAAQHLKVIGRAGTGLDNIDVKAAEKSGIKIFNTPGSNSRAVAELAVALMFMLARKLYQATTSVKDEKWEKSKLIGNELNEKVLGLIGFGKIGQITGKIASAMGMNVLVYKRGSIDYSPGFEFERVEFNKILEKSDFISIHVPKNDETVNMFGTEQFKQMKESAYLINCARGGIVNEKELLDALNNNIISGAALDVFETEPPQKFELIKHQKIIATPHIAASSHESQLRVGEDIVNSVIDFLENTYLFFGNK